jgi:hypothetical protein
VHFPQPDRYGYEWGLKDSQRPRQVLFSVWGVLEAREETCSSCCSQGIMRWVLNSMITLFYRSNLGGWTSSQHRLY